MSSAKINPSIASSEPLSSRCSDEEFWTAMGGDPATIDFLRRGLSPRFCDTAELSPHILAGGAAGLIESKPHELEGQSTIHFELFAQMGPDGWPQHAIVACDDFSVAEEAISPSRASQALAWIDQGISPTTWLLATDPELLCSFALALPTLASAMEALQLREIIEAVEQTLPVFKPRL